MTTLARMPERNLLSRRVPHQPKPLNVGDYIAAVRGDTPLWGQGEFRTPQWLAGTELVSLGVKDKLSSVLNAQLRTPLLDGLSSPPKTHAVIEAYLADVSRIDGEVSAFRTMLDTIARNQTFVYDQSGRPQPIASWHDINREVFLNVQRTRRLGPPQLGAPVVSADLVAGGGEGVRVACAQDVRRRVESAAGHVVEGLVDGLGSGLLGVVSWPSTDTCCYVRNEQQLFWTSDSERMLGERRREITQSYEHWMLCKAVDLMDAMHLKGIPGWLELPERVAEVAASIPCLLHPFVGTVLGTMIRCREIRWFVANRQYSHEQAVPQARPVPDPAITIGPVVLTGWESPEHFEPGWWAKLDMGLARR